MRFAGFHPGSPKIHRPGLHAELTGSARRSIFESAQFGAHIPSAFSADRSRVHAGNADLRQYPAFRLR